MGANGQLQCGFCHDHLSGRGIRCCSCGTVLHFDCVRELGRCPTIGCANAVAGRPPEVIEARPSEPRARSRWTLPLWALCVTILATFATVTLAWFSNCPEPRRATEGQILAFLLLIPTALTVPASLIVAILASIAALVSAPAPSPGTTRAQPSSSPALVFFYAAIWLTVVVLAAVLLIGGIGS